MTTKIYPCPFCGETPEIDGTARNREDTRDVMAVTHGHQHTCPLNGLSFRKDEWNLRSRYGFNSTNKI